MIQPDEAVLRDQSHRFEAKNNSRWRYGTINGLMPLKALASSNRELRFPRDRKPSRHPIPEPEQGKYHFVRFVKSDGVLTIFKEHFNVPPEAIYEYVMATVDNQKQTMILTLDGNQIDEWDYHTR